MKKVTRATLLRAADLFSSVCDDTKKAAASMKLFGRNGPMLIPYLNMGPAAIEEIEREARALGLLPPEPSLIELLIDEFLWGFQRRRFERFMERIGAASSMRRPPR